MMDNGKTTTWKDKGNIKMKPVMSMKDSLKVDFLMEMVL
jgi:hypothetical protein